MYFNDPTISITVNCITKEQLGFVYSLFLLSVLKARLAQPVTTLSGLNESTQNGIADVALVWYCNAAVQNNGGAK